MPSFPCMEQDSVLVKVCASVWVTDKMLTTSPNLWPSFKSTSLNGFQTQSESNVCTSYMGIINISTHFDAKLMLFILNILKLQAILSCLHPLESIRATWKLETSVQTNINPHTKKRSFSICTTIKVILRCKTSIWTINYMIFEYIKYMKIHYCAKVWGQYFFLFLLFFFN